jgi:O-antigen chain-terminating methyltransferase
MSVPEHFPDLAEKLHAIRERVRRRVERATSDPEPLQVPSLERVRELLDQARSLAPAIGSLNPRPPGIANELAQTAKRTQARLSDWQLRPQRGFNQAVADSLEAMTAALEAVVASLATVSRELGALRSSDRELAREFDLLGEHATQQRWAFEGALMRQTESLERLRNDVRQQTEPELQALRQRVANLARSQSAPQAGGPSGGAPRTERATTALQLDYFQLEHHFRGTEEEIRKRQSFYLPFFRNRKQVLDIACGRGEFLELMRDAGVPAKGVDLDADMIGRCLEKKLEVTQADVFAYLANVADASLDGIFSAQFIEHLAPETYLRLIAQCAAKLAPGGVLALETQNPECLAIFSQSFFLDPTHVKPIPAAQLRFALADAGFAQITTHFLSPAAAVLPTLPQLPEGAMERGALHTYNAAVAKFNETFLGGMDYAVIGYRPSPVG